MFTKCNLILFSIFDELNNILYIKETGHVTLKDKKDLFSKIFKIIDVHKKLKILQDSRGIEHFNSVEEIDMFYSFIAKIIKSKNFIVFHAVIHDSPKGTALGMIYEDISSRNDYYHKIFNTKEAAELWLNKSSTY